MKFEFTAEWEGLRQRFGKKVKCDVCGHRFKPIKEKVYLATPERGLVAMFNPKDVFSVIDCENCGCQIMLKGRLDTYKSDYEGDK